MFHGINIYNTDHFGVILVI